MLEKVFSSAVNFVFGRLFRRRVEVIEAYRLIDADLCYAQDNIVKGLLYPANNENRVEYLRAAYARLSTVSSRIYEVAEGSRKKEAKLIYDKFVSSQLLPFRRLHSEDKLLDCSHDEEKINDVEKSFARFRAGLKNYFQELTGVQVFNF